MHSDTATTTREVERETKKNRHAILLIANLKCSSGRPDHRGTTSVTLKLCVSGRMKMTNGLSEGDSVTAAVF